MKLYYLPGACSVASHIVINELGIPAEFVRVIREPRTTEQGEDYLKISPNGYVPALALDDGTVLLENAAILPYLGELKPESGWMPASGMDRYRTLGWIGYLNSEIHANYKPLFMGQDAIKDFVHKRLRQRYQLVDDALATHPYLIGDKPTVADAYLFVVTNWAGRVKLDLGGLDHIAAFMARMRERPAVQKTLKEEGLA